MRLTWTEILVLTILATSPRALAQKGGLEPASGGVTVGALLAEFADPLAALLPAVPPWTLESRSGKGGRRLSRPVLGGAGQKELFRATGPGALVRLSIPRARGHLRFFVDGNPIPVVDAEAKDIVGGGLTLFAPPFSMRSAEGGVLLFPIPFATSLLVTTDVENLPWSASWRRYPQKTPVRPFEMKDAVMQSFGAAEALGGLRASLAPVPLKQPAGDVSVTIPPAPIQVSVEPGQTVTVFQREVKSPALVTHFAFEETLPFLSASDAERLSLDLVVDGKSVANLPLLDFFGRTDASHLCATRWIAAVSRFGGVLLRRSIGFPIPFEKTIVVRLTNGSDKAVRDLRFSIDTGPGDERFQGVLFRVARGVLPGHARVAATLVRRDSSSASGPRGPFQWTWKYEELDAFPLGVPGGNPPLIAWGYSRRSR